jgi:predicted alpha/beta superfamily hydrolase
MKMKFVLICLLTLICGCSDEPNASKSLSTAAPNVQILPFAFVLDGLDRQRTIRVYLPPNYDRSSDAYSVVYMQDGQNLFDDSTAYAGEWGVDETLNELSQQQGLNIIVVGIDNGGEKRMNEYSPWENNRFGAAEGEQYMDFVVEVVKPYIDTNYRTLSDVQHTAIIGSSMGGLIAHYALHAYPNVFGKAAIFSPSYWYSPEVFVYTNTHKAALDAKIYVMFGDKEGDGMIVDTGRMEHQLREQGHPRQNMLFKRVVGGEHNESLWRSEFSAAIRWLFPS